jgi:hypothetical protein
MENCIEYICFKCKTVEENIFNNPTMEEELYCALCMKENKMNLANFLIQGIATLNPQVNQAVLTVTGKLID